SPVVLDQKPDGSYRMCIDYKKMNSQTPLNAAPMQNMNSILRQIPEGYFYSCIDLKSGFWQISLSEDSIAKSAFCTEKGLWEFLVMPFGLKCAPKTFVGLMNHIFKKYIDKFVKIFVDDILIYSKTIE